MLNKTNQSDVREDANQLVVHDVISNVKFKYCRIGYFFLHFIYEILISIVESMMSHDLCIHDLWFAIYTNDVLIHQNLSNFSLIN